MKKKVGYFIVVVMLLIRQTGNAQIEAIDFIYGNPYSVSKEQIIDAWDYCFINNIFL